MDGTAIQVSECGERGLVSFFLEADYRGVVLIGSDGDLGITGVEAFGGVEDSLAAALGEVYILDGVADDLDGALEVDISGVPTELSAAVGVYGGDASVAGDGNVLELVVSGEESAQIDRGARLTDVIGDF